MVRYAREQATSESERQGWLVLLCATEWDNRLTPAFFALDVDPNHLSMQPAKAHGQVAAEFRQTLLAGSASVVPHTCHKRA
jgi:hypothetical protein